MFANQVRKERRLGLALKKEGRSKKKKGEGFSGPVHDPDKCFEAIRLGSRCWAHFSSDTDDGRELFRRMNLDAIRNEALTIKAGNSGAAHAIALKNLWGKADQAEWHGKAKQHVDIFKLVFISLS